jgi:hypothetical protein
MNTKAIAAGLAAVSVCANVAPASATETIIYTYDAKGRLIKVERAPTSTVNKNVKTEYQHDKADNRKNTTTTGSPNTSQ